MLTNVSKQEGILGQSSNFDDVSFYIEGFYLKQRSQRSSPETLKWYKKKLDAFVWFLNHEGYPIKFQDITPNHIRYFLIYLQEQKTNRWGSNAHSANRPLTAWGIHGFARALRAFFKWASKEADRPNPFDKVDMPSLPNAWRVETYSQSDIAQLFKACENGSTDFTRQRDRTILAILLDSGLRASELLSLTTKSVSPHEGIFTVTGKGGKIRDVVIGSFAKHELWVYLRDHRGMFTNHDALFVSQGGSPLTYSGLAQIFKRIRLHSGIEVRVHAHKCRHSFATLAHANGMRGATLQTVLGHSGFDVTRRFYLDISKEALSKEHERYGPLDNLRNQIKPTSNACQAEKVLNENGRWIPSLPDPKTLLQEIQGSNYRRVARKYGVSDTTLRNRLRQAGLI